VIGKGQFGKVYIAQKDGKRFAIKSVGYETDEEIKDADEEEKIFDLLKGSCAYIVDYFESFDDVFFFFS
jgi:hypothetical protein